MSSPRSSAGRAARPLAALLLLAGAAHFARPRTFDALVPRSLPGGPRAWTYASGVAELAIGTAVAVPRTRRIGGLAAAGLFVAVLPGNVKMAVDWRRRPTPYRQGAWARVPLQIPLVWWALRVGRKV
ncbi:MauE/DoxX family redox-associated membrane protein [Kitasatospora herbaricolor]|uniref:Methylamine utilisation protein MauE domain-containing protein n=1 Tax=Kitasatospora herbaricolor TaxID=68217 RepID=A0ABZ1W118_9ACTN|nr:MauE/DoxX family redox-associated membrane protein [Kitasatospora herbaricolor]